MKFHKQNFPLLSLLLIISLIFLIKILLVSSTSLPPVINIGVVFDDYDDDLDHSSGNNDDDDEDKHLLDALNTIVKNINNDRKLLPRTNLSIKLIKSKDSFRVTKSGKFHYYYLSLYRNDCPTFTLKNNGKIGQSFRYGANTPAVVSLSPGRLVCELFNEKIWLILSSRTDSVKWFIYSAADLFHIPHISLEWDHKLAYIDNVNFPKSNGGLNSRMMRMMMMNNNQNDFDYDESIQRGPNGGFFMADPKQRGGVGGGQPAGVFGNAQTGFRFQPNRNTFDIGNRLMNENDLEQRRKYLKLKKLHKHMTLNLYPDVTELSEALKEFIYERNWKSFTLIYDSNESLIKCKDLLTLSNNNPKPGKPKMKISLLNFTEYEEITKQQMKTLKNMNPSHPIHEPIHRQQQPGQPGQGQQGRRPNNYPNYYDDVGDYHDVAIGSQFEPYDSHRNPIGYWPLNPQQQPQQNRQNFRPYHHNHPYNDTSSDMFLPYPPPPFKSPYGEGGESKFEKNFLKPRKNGRLSPQGDYLVYDDKINDDIYVKIWKDIKVSEHYFILSLTYDHVLKFLRKANELKRMTEYDNYFIISMDILHYNLTEFQHLEPLPNITSLSIIDTSKNLPYQHQHQQQLYQQFSQNIPNVPNVNNNNEDNNNDFNNLPPPYYHYPIDNNGSSHNIGQKSFNSNLLTTKQALIFDAITLFSKALDDLDRSHPELIVEPIVSCNDVLPPPHQSTPSSPSSPTTSNENFGQTSTSTVRKWPLGLHLIDYMKNTQLKGYTGLLLFNRQGLRVNFTLDILQLKNNGLKTIAKWSKLLDGIRTVTNYSFTDSYKEILQLMKFKELIVTVPPSSVPYVKLKDDKAQRQGNDQYEGFCIDLLEKIAEVFRKNFQSDFKYKIQVTADGQYGRPNKETGEWNGMFGELMRHQADLAIADLTATYQREKAVDFTMPFMNLGIAILFKKPSAPEPEMFSFLKPFSVEVWLYLASAFLGISLLLWIMSRISPYEWQAPHSCDPDPMELNNQFSIGNSLWFTIGSLMQQGSDLAPRALSTRTLATIWWFFTLIIISSYTANLAASLTLSRMAPAISSAEDLAKQSSILYGCRKGGSTYEFFANSNNSIYQRMFNTMESNPEVYIHKIDDAIERVRKGGYAYLAESSTIEYLIQRRCDLIQVGNWLDNKGYGIATPPDSPYRTPISNAITVLQDSGELYRLKKKWWEEKIEGGKCAEDSKITSAAELEIENLGGVFLVLVMGVTFGIVSGFCEFIWKSLKIAPDERESIPKLIWLEMFRICTGGSSSRPVMKPSPSTINMANNMEINDANADEDNANANDEVNDEDSPGYDDNNENNYYNLPPPYLISGTNSNNNNIDIIPLKSFNSNSSQNQRRSRGRSRGRNGAKGGNPNNNNQDNMQRQMTMASNDSMEPLLRRINSDQSLNNPNNNPIQSTSFIASSIPPQPILSPPPPPIISNLIRQQQQQQQPPPLYQNFGTTNTSNSFQSNRF